MSSAVQTQPPRRALIAGTLVFTAVAVAALTWAKWSPYWNKLFIVATTHTLGPSIVTGKSATPPAPSWAAAVSYTFDYGRSIWIALVAGLLIAASVEAFLPQRRLLALFQHEKGDVAGAVAGGLLAMPSMMCTCCAAPLAVSVRRQGVSIASTLAYWVGNPTLNPAALAFMAIVLPWQFVTVRLILGVVLVFGVTMLVGRWSGVRRGGDDTVMPVGTEDAATAVVPTTVTDAGRRFLSALARLSITLLPEYLVVVLLLGGMRGWLFPAGHDVATWGILAVILFAVVGTLFVIPTAAEIPIIQGLLMAGAGTGVAGALLITLPAISLPSMVMVGGALPRRVIGAMAASVTALGLVSAALLVLLFP